MGFRFAPTEGFMMTYEQSDVTYDAIYEDMKDYKREAGVVKRLIGVNRYRHRSARPIRLLDVACGTGLHLQHFDERYEIRGLDLSEAQLAVARKRLPGVQLDLADMRYFRLGRQFDAVTCLFSAIGHMMTDEDYQAAINRMASHLAPGGILLVEPWLSPDQWQDGHFSCDHVNLPKLKVTRMTWTRREGRITHLKMHHLVGRPEGPELIVAEHQTVLRTTEEQLVMFEKAGLAAWFDPAGLNSHGRGVLIGQIPF